MNYLRYRSYCIIASTNPQVYLYVTYTAPRYTNMFVKQGLLNFDFEIRESDDLAGLKFHVPHPNFRFPLDMVELGYNFRIG